MKMLRRHWELLDSLKDGEVRDVFSEALPGWRGLERVGLVGIFAGRFRSGRLRYGVFLTEKGRIVGHASREVKACEAQSA